MSKKRLSEKQLLEKMTPYNAHADELHNVFDASAIEADEDESQSEQRSTNNVSAFEVAEALLTVTQEYRSKGNKLGYGDLANELGLLLGTVSPDKNRLMHDFEVGFRHGIELSEQQDAKEKVLELLDDLKLSRLVKSREDQEEIEVKLDELDEDPNEILAYRVYDLRNRFDTPFATVIDALQAIFSERAYLPEESGEIIAYWTDGRQLTVPAELFVLRVPRFTDEEQAREWLTERNTKIAGSGGLGQLMGIAVANPNDSFEKQMADAMAFRDLQLNRYKPLDEIAQEIETWLDENRELAR